MGWDVSDTLICLSKSQQDLINKHYSSMVEVVTRRVPRHRDDMLDDALNAAFVALVGVAGRYVESKGDFWPFAKPRVRGAVCDLFRSRSGRYSVELEDHHAQNQNHTQVRVMVTEATGSLSPRDCALVDTIYQEYTTKEIAERLGVSSSWINRRKKSSVCGAKEGSQ